MNQIRLGVENTALLTDRLHNVSDDKWGLQSQLGSSLADNSANVTDSIIWRCLRSTRNRRIQRSAAQRGSKARKGRETGRRAMEAMEVDEVGYMTVGRGGGGDISNH